MVIILDHYEGCRTEKIVEDPMLVPRRIMDGWKPQLVDELPDVFCGSWASYFSYDTMWFVEKKRFPFFNAPPDDRNLPDIHLSLYDDVLDHVEKITGEMFDNLNSWDVFCAALLVGPVSGGPKVKAMELIDQLELSPRGPYTGGFGGITFSGDMDIAFALATIVITTNFYYDTMFSYKDVNKRREWVAHLQVGIGIVADSDSADEHKGYENITAAPALAIDLADSSFLKTEKIF